MFPKIEPDPFSLFPRLRSDQKVVLRPSEINSWGMCPKSVGYSRLGIRPEYENANLAFGTCGHYVVELYVRGEISAGDMPKIFDIEWRKAAMEKPIIYAKTVGWEQLHSIGMELMKLFPKYWKNTGLRPLVIEKRVETHVGGNTYISACPDLVALATKDYYIEGCLQASKGDVVINDWKFPSLNCNASPAFSRKAKQLSYYMMTVNDNEQELDLPGPVTAVGFVDFIKKPIPKTPKGSGPFIEPLHLFGRTELQLEEARRYARFIADQIRVGFYPENPQLAFNTPCDGMVDCDFINPCVWGETDGIKLPDSLTPEMVVGG